MNSKKVRITAIALFVQVCCAFQADGQFIRGRIYIPTLASEPNCWFNRPRIFELDPVTHQLRLFSTLSCNYWDINGAVFTPDGQWLLTSSPRANVVLAIAPNGGVNVRLTVNNGLAGPGGLQPMAFDALGAFYVTDWAARILKFPPGASNPQVFADSADGVVGGGSMSLAPSGQLYYMSDADIQSRILRFTPDGQASVFQEYAAPCNQFGERCLLWDIAVDSAGNVFVMKLVPGTPNSVSLLKYVAGNPAVEQTVANHLPFVGPIALSLDESIVYVADRGSTSVFAVDIATGQFTNLYPDSIGAIPSGICISRAVVSALPADANCDGQVNGFDIRPFVMCLVDQQAYLEIYPGCANGDLNADGLVDAADIQAFVAAIGG